MGRHDNESRWAKHSSSCNRAMTSTMVMMLINIRNPSRFPVVIPHRIMMRAETERSVVVHITPSAMMTATRVMVMKIATKKNRNSNNIVEGIKMV